MRWFKKNKKVSKVVEEEKRFLGGTKKYNFDKLEETRKMIIDGIVYGYAKEGKKIPDELKIYDITPEILEEFKNDFNKSPSERRYGGGHIDYTIWLAKIGLKYNQRANVPIIIKGILEYSNGKLDYRNRRMKENRKYKQNRTKRKEAILEKQKIFKEGE